MKKILFLLLLSVSMYGQVPADATPLENIQITNNIQDNVTDRVSAVTAEGVINWKYAKDLKIPTKADLSTGLLKNGLISANGDPTKFNITAGIGIISNFDDPENPTSTIINFPAFTGITPTYLLTGTITYVAINSTPAVVMQATAFTPEQRRSLIVLGAVIHSNLTNINVVNNISAPTNATTNQLHDFIEAVGALNLTGNKYTANGANLQLNKSAGLIFKLGSNFANDWKNPHELAQSAMTSLTFRYRTQNGTEGSDRINLDPALYDNNNVLTAVPNNKFTIQTVTMFQSGVTRIQYGQNVYDDLATAKNAVFTRNFVLEPNSKENGIIRAYIIMKNTTTSLQNVADADILEAQKFGGVASGGVALTLANIVTALGYTPANDTDVIHKTGNETKAGILTLSDQLTLNKGYLLNTVATEPSATDGTHYKLTQPTTAGQSWSTTYYPVLSKYNGLLEYSRNKPATFRKKLMVIGSSVAFGVGATGNNGWANRLSVDLIARGWLYKNHAIGGNTTVDVINRFYLDVVPENPDVLIIGLSLGNEGIMGVGKEAVYESFKTSLQKLVLMCRQQGIVPVIANCYPRNEYTSVEYKYVQQMNRELDSWGIPVINLLGAVDDLTGKFVVGSVDVDGLHPNDVGHQEMYKTIPPSMFDCLVNWDEKRLVPEKGAIRVASDGSTEKPIEAIFDGALSNFTVSFWFKNNDASGSGKVVAGLGTSSSRLANSAGIGLRYISNVGGSVNFGVFPELTNNWYHIAFSYNAVTQKIRVYMNGVFINELTETITLSRLAIGGRSDTGQASFNSVNTDFKDIAIYRSRMTDIQIKELYSGNITKSSLEIFSPLSDKDVSATRRILNFAPTLSYLKVNSTAFTSIDRGVINTDIVSTKNVTESLIVSTDPTTSSEGAKIRVSGIVNSVGGVARGIYSSTTSTATANNDLLSSVYLNPIFNAGAFTGVQSAPLRILPRGTLGHISLGTNSNAGLLSFARGSDGLTQAYVGYNTASDVGDFIMSSASVSGTLSFLTNSIKQAQFFNNGNLLIQNGGTFTDAGFRLDVNGTTRLNGNVTITGIPTAPTATAGTSTTQLATTAFVQAQNTATLTDYVSKTSVLEQVVTAQISAPSFKSNASYIVASTGAGLTAPNNGSISFISNSPATPGWTSNTNITATFYKTTVYTVATLPTTGVVSGTYATVSDALAPTYMATVVGGGAIVTPVFYNGTNWVAH